MILKFDILFLIQDNVCQDSLLWGGSFLVFGEYLDTCWTSQIENKVDSKEMDENTNMGKPIGRIPTHPVSLEKELFLQEGESRVLAEVY